MNKILPPKFSNKPFKKVKVPAELYSKIMKEYNSMSFDQVHDQIDHNDIWGNVAAGISIKGSDTPFYNLCFISQELYNECFSVLTPLLQEWSGVKIEKTYGYGIRSYVRNSILNLHRDRYDTHIISCIIFIDEKSEEKWPLDFFDHEHNHHKIIFEPGDMVFYESLCVHGRITPFNGDYYRNMYFHWKPVDWIPESYVDLNTSFKDVGQYLNFYI